VSDQLSRVFAALADPTRRDMVVRLTEADHTVGDLAEPYDVSLQAVSKHLRVLEDAGLVSRTRDAQRRPVHLEAEVFDLMTKWIERYRRQAETRFAAPGHPHPARLRRHPGPALQGSHRPRALRPVERAEQRRRRDHRVGRP